MKVENLELKLVTKVEDLPTVVHGTYLKLWEAICTSLDTLLQLASVDFERISERGIEDDDSKPYSLRRRTGGKRRGDEWCVSPLYIFATMLTR